jgi:protein-S-isoprenylcysteine O-methyltransferase Ste14
VSIATNSEPTRCNEGPVRLQSRLQHYRQYGLDRRSVVLAGRHLALVARLGDCRCYVLRCLGMVVSLWNTRSGLLEERFKPAIQKGQPLPDRILLLSFLAFWFGLIAFTSADVFQLHLMNKPGPLVSSFGLFLVALGSWIQYRAFRDNAFAALVVRHQAERNQTVSDTGVYSVVRHPMYGGGVILMVGTPLWLESYAGALLAAVPAATLVLRILLEERFLKRELTGYDAYTQKVRYRLIPFVW